MPRNQIIPVFIPHLGCPNDCVFCDQKRITGRDTPVTPDEVVLQIEAGLKKSGKGAVLAFYGGSFTAIDPALQEGLLSAAQPYLKRGDLSALRVSTRPDAIDDSVIARLRRFGVETVELGCQSMDDRVLNLSGRGHSREDTLRASRLLKENGFHLILQMMTGLPGDSGTESIRTAEEIIALQPDGVRIYPTVVLKNTALEDMMRSGSYQPQSVEDAAELCALLYEKFLAADIPVIRLGLNPTELLSSGGAVAGAYHPALGEIVLSRMYLRRAEKLLSGCRPGSYSLMVHKSRVSVMVGQKRCNMVYFREHYPGIRLRVCPGAAELWQIELKKEE